MILVVNPGSSSIKFRLFKTDSTIPVSILEGLAERIGLDGQLKIEYQEKKSSFSIPMPNHEAAVEAIYQKFMELKVVEKPEEITAIGFRVVHGGQKITQPVLVNAEIKTVIKESIKLAPLHNPGALTAIEAFEKKFPASKLVSCFDTAFHQTMPMENYLYAVPYEWYEKHQVRKFGFHGISYEYISQKMATQLKKPINELNLIVCHLGNGSSICAIENGKSLDTTMGLTPLAGLMMGTRSGDIDPSILAYMAKETNQDVFQITDVLNKASGLLGVSQLSSDMRDLLAGVDENKKLAILAYEKYVAIIAGFVIKFANQLQGKIDAIVFTAGIGENSFEVRQDVIKHLPLLNLKIDEAKNLEKYADLKLISTSDSQLPVYAVRTNEELMICQQTWALTKK